MVIRYRLKKDVSEAIKHQNPKAFELRNWGFCLMVEAAVIAIGFLSPYPDNYSELVVQIKILATFILASFLFIGYFIWMIGENIRRSLLIKMIVKSEYIEEKDQVI